MVSDCTLIAKKNNFDFFWNSKFPINSLNIMRGYLFVNTDLKDLYLDIIFAIIIRQATKNHDQTGYLHVKIEISPKT